MKIFIKTLSGPKLFFTEYIYVAFILYLSYLNVTILIWYVYNLRGSLNKDESKINKHKIKQTWMTS